MLIREPWGKNKKEDYHKLEYKKSIYDSLLFFYLFPKVVGFTHIQL